MKYEITNFSGLLIIRNNIIRKWERINLMDLDGYFWWSWKEFSCFEILEKKYPSVYNNGKNEQKVMWTKCKYAWKIDNKLFEKWNYSGIVLNQRYESPEARTKREKIQVEYKKNLSKLNSSWYDKIAADFECLIWNDIVCLEASLQWNKCSRTFCYYCLIDWLKRTSNCPNWKAKIGKHDLKV